MQRWISSVIAPVFSVTWSSEIILIYWFAAQETFLFFVTTIFYLPKNTNMHGKGIKKMTKYKDIQLYTIKSWKKRENVITLVQSSDKVIFLNIIKNSPAV